MITKETAIELAKEVNATPYTNRHFLDRPFFTFSPEQLEAFCNLAVAHAAKDVEPVHTDHPMRHYDRTCPACQDAEPVAYLWQHCETGRTRIVMPDDVITADATWFVVGPLFTHPAKQVPSAAMQLVTKQADDEGLWFEALTAPEAHLQAALRKLHAAVESSQKQVPMTDEQAAAIRTLTFLGYTYHGAEHWKPPLGVGK